MTARPKFAGAGAGLLCAVLALVFVSGWAAPRAARADDAPVRIVATIAQIGDPVARMTEGTAQVDTLLGEGVDPHLYRPTRSDIARLSRADVILYNGLTLEAQLLRPIDQLRGRASVLAIGETVGGDLLLPYDAGPGDPHVWMDPVLWGRALQAGIERLAQVNPLHADLYRTRLAAYRADLERLDAYGQQVMATIPENRRILVTAHDAFGYFGRRYGLRVEGIQGISTESEAGLRTIEQKVDLLVTQKIPAVFVETSVSDRQVRALIEGARARGHEVRIGGQLYSDAMGAPGTYEGTYIGMLDHNLTTIARALGGEAPERGLNGRLSGGAE